MTYFLNHMGFTINDDEMKKVRFPRAEVYTHVTWKCTQAGSLVGAAVVGPIQCLQEGKYDVESLRSKAFQCSKQGLIAGFVMGPILAHLRLRNQAMVTIYDRAYRLRYNFNQVRTDRFSLLGSLAGAGAAYYLGENLQEGVVFGYCGGCLLAGVYNYLMGTALTLQSAI